MYSMSVSHRSNHPKAGTCPECLATLCLALPACLLSAAHHNTQTFAAVIMEYDRSESHACFWCQHDDLPSKHSDRHSIATRPVVRMCCPCSLFLRQAAIVGTWLKMKALNVCCPQKLRHEDNSQNASCKPVQASDTGCKLATGVHEWWRIIRSAIFFCYCRLMTDRM